MPKPLTSLLLALLVSACSPAEDPPDASTENAVILSEPATPVTRTEPTPSRTLVIAADPWCPYNCAVDSDYEGYMVDIAREIFEAEGYRVEYVNISWARALQLTREGHLDAVVGAFVTDAPDFVFPDVPQGRSRIAFFTHGENDWNFQGLDSLKNQTLLAINGYSYTEELDRYIQDHRGNQERVWILSGPAPLDRAIQLLNQRRTDVFVEDHDVMVWALKNHATLIPHPREAGRFAETEAYVAFSPARPDARELARVLTEGTLRLRKSGRIDQIMANYGLSYQD